MKVVEGRPVAERGLHGGGEEVHGRKEQLDDGE